MPRASFFAQLGMFVVQGFFDAALCASLRREMRSASTMPTRILESQNQLRVDEHQRRTEVSLPPKNVSLAERLNFGQGERKCRRARGRSPEELAKEFEPTAQAIRNWVAKSEDPRGKRPQLLTNAEREELGQLRKENRKLRLEREILATATAWFAREAGTTPRRSSGS